MSGTFIASGGDEDFGVGLFTIGGGSTINPTAATDFVRGFHKRSIKFATNANSYLIKPNLVTDAGGRISNAFYVNALPTGNEILFVIEQAGDGTPVLQVMCTSAGVLQLWDSAGQIGTNGPTIKAGQGFRLCLCWKITSTTVNEARLFKDAVLAISTTNVTLHTVTSADYAVGNAGDATFDFRLSDVYADASNSLVDTGDVWVTAKRSFANGTATNFTTQIGSGGSGYGTGHAPQVNERPNSDSNGWSMVGAGSAVTEEYNIEGASVGDVDLAGGTIVDYMGWVRAKSLSSETGKIIVNNVQSNISLTSTIQFFMKMAGSTTYPAGSGTDIGIITSTTLTTVSLYECGISVAFIPTQQQLSMMGVGS